MWLSTPPGGDDFVFAGDHLRRCADDQFGIDAVHGVRIAGFADFDDLAVADADIAFDYAPMGDNDCICNDKIEHACPDRALGCAALTHSVANDFAAESNFYGGSHTLWDVDINVPAGSRMCLTGRNGMGKTILLKCVMGLQASKSGDVKFDGTDLLKCRAEQRAKLGI